MGGLENSELVIFGGLLAVLLSFLFRFGVKKSLKFHFIFRIIRPKMLTRMFIRYKILPLQTLGTIYYAIKSETARWEKFRFRA